MEDWEDDERNDCDKYYPLEYYSHYFRLDLDTFKKYINDLSDRKYITILENSDEKGLYTFEPTFTKDGTGTDRYYWAYQLEKEGKLYKD